MTKGRETTQAERIGVAKACIANGKNYGEVAIAYNVSYQQARSWTLKYIEGGESALEDRRGQRKKDQLPRTELEQAQIEIEQLKHNSRAIGMGVTAGVLASMITVLLLVLILGMDHRAYVTMLPKSITTAIGMGVSEELGGNTPVTIMVIIITGIVGNILSERFLRIMHIKHPIAKGIAIGSAAHVIGTSKAMEMGKTEGAMSSLAIVTSGIITVVVASVFASLA